MDGKDILVKADPNVRGVYAVRRIKDEADFLIRPTGNVESDAENVEEVEFESWPPKIRGDGGFGNIFL